MGWADAALTVQGYMLEAAVNVTNKLTVVDGLVLSTTASEAACKARGAGRRYRNIAAGQDVYARAACTGTPDATMTACVYGVGG